MGTFKIAKTVLRSMFNKPATLMYPVVEREYSERTRGSVDIDTEQCILCGLCTRRCPAKAIETKRNTGEWTIHRMRCIQCGECIDVCPKECLSMNSKYTEPDSEKIVDIFEIAAVKKAEEKKTEVDKKDNASAKSSETAKETNVAKSEDLLLCNIDECIFCGLCAKNCPCEALTVDRKAKLWEVDDEACVKCEACISKCPKDCLRIGKPDAAAKETIADKEQAAPEKPELPKKSEAPEKTETSEEKKSIPMLEEEKCIYCRMCENTCPEEAILAEMDDWKLDVDKCVSCGACIGVCPAEALKMKHEIR